MEPYTSIRRSVTMSPSLRNSAVTCEVVMVSLNHSTPREDMPWPRPSVAKFPPS